MKCKLNKLHFSYNKNTTFTFKRNTPAAEYPVVDWGQLVSDPVGHVSARRCPRVSCDDDTLVVLASHDGCSGGHFTVSQPVVAVRKCHS